MCIHIFVHLQLDNIICFCSRALSIITGILVSHCSYGLMSTVNDFGEDAHLQCP